jgi:hypothetical protein
MSPCSKRRFSLASAPGRSRPELLLRDHAGEVEFITIMRFDDIPPIRAFAGADYEAAVVPAAARLCCRASTPGRNTTNPG